jgi:4,5-DOPA dioxygenase extradiol
VLILCSGSFTHNLHEIPRPFRQIETPAPDWVRGFADWAAAAIVEGRTGDLLDYRRVAPHGARNHPTEEHFLPLFAAMGAGGGGAGRRMHDSTTFAVLRMDAYAFG